MQRKKAGELLKSKVSIEVNDDIINFSKNLPLGLADNFNKLLTVLIPELYYADRLTEAGWLPVQEELPVPFEPLLLWYTTGIHIITGYYDGEVFRHGNHQFIYPPLLYQYITLPL